MYLPLGISNKEMKMSLTHIPLGFYNDDHIVHFYCIYLYKSTFRNWIWYSLFYLTFFQTIISRAVLLKHCFAAVIPKYDTVHPITVLLGPGRMILPPWRSPWGSRHAFKCISSRYFILHFVFSSTWEIWE